MPQGLSSLLKLPHHLHNLILVFIQSKRCLDLGYFIFLYTLLYNYYYYYYYYHGISIIIYWFYNICLKVYNNYTKEATICSGSLSISSCISKLSILFCSVTTHICMLNSWSRITNLSTSKSTPIVAL